jgi:hypothetical protein
MPRKSSPIVLVAHNAIDTSKRWRAQAFAHRADGGRFDRHSG